MIYEYNIFKNDGHIKIIHLKQIHTISYKLIQLAYYSLQTLAICYIIVGHRLVFHVKLAFSVRFGRY